MKSLFINEPDDMKWLFETALKPSNIQTRDGEAASFNIDTIRDRMLREQPEPCAAVVQGNEDSPDRIEVYAAMEPSVGEAHVLYVQNDDGFYDECFVPEAKTKSGGTRFHQPTPPDDNCSSCHGTGTQGNGPGVGGCTDCLGTGRVPAGQGDSPDDDAERNCRHEWNQSAAEADESGTGIYCIKCGQDGDA